MKTSFKSINPTNNSLIRTYYVDDLSTIQQKIVAADQTFQDWRKASFQKRAGYFQKMSQLILKDKEAFAKLITEEMGKPLKQAVAEVEKCAWVCNYYAERAATFLQNQEIDTEASKTFVTFQPLGTILQIMPWNFPFWQVFRFAAPALMAGNVTLLKHAPNVLGCAAAIEFLFEAAGFPDGVFQQVVAEVEDIGEIMATAQVQGVALTGSLRAGSAVGALAGANIKKCVLELGGSDAFVVLEDADLEKAAEVAVRSRMHNSGQTCISAKRFIVVGAVAEQFKKLVKQQISKLVVGDPLDPNTDIGAMARPDLIETLENQVRKSVEMGAVLEVVGGRIGQTNYYKPALLCHIKKGMPAYSEELFGPVIAFFEVPDEQAALELANDTVFGLAATIWSADSKRAEQLALQLDVGAVAINQIMRSDPRIPFGGTKMSGIGRELGRMGILEFVNAKSIVIA